MNPIRSLSEHFGYTLSPFQVAGQPFQVAVITITWPGMTGSCFCFHRWPLHLQIEPNSTLPHADVGDSKDQSQVKYMLPQPKEKLNLGGFNPFFFFCRAYQTRNSHFPLTKDASYMGVGVEPLPTHFVRMCRRLIQTNSCARIVKI